MAAARARARAERSRLPVLTAGDVLRAIQAGLEAERRAMRSMSSKRLEELSP